MRRLSFVIAIAGLFVLSLFFSFEGKEVDSLGNLEINEKVIVKGKVVEERNIYFGTKLFILDNGIEIVCECSESFLDRDVRIEGLAEEYEGRKQIRALKVYFLPQLKKNKIYNLTYSFF